MWGRRHDEERHSWPLYVLENHQYQTPPASPAAEVPEPRVSTFLAAGSMENGQVNPRHQFVRQDSYHRQHGEGSVQMPAPYQTNRQQSYQSQQSGPVVAAPTTIASAFRAPDSVESVRVNPRHQFVRQDSYHNLHAVPATELPKTMDVSYPVAEATSITSVPVNPRHQFVHQDSFQSVYGEDGGRMPMLTRYLPVRQVSYLSEYGGSNSMREEGSSAGSLIKVQATTMNMSNALSIEPHSLPGSPPPADEWPIKTLLPPPTKSHRIGAMSILEALKLKPADFYKLPAVRGSPAVRAIRWKIATVYRRLFAIVFLTNMAVLGVYCHLRFRKGLALRDPNAQVKVFKEIQTAIAANLMASILIRNEHFVNLLYRILIIHTPTSAPLWLRRLFAKLYCMGGVHSGSAVSATAWYLLLTIAALLNQPPSKVQAVLLSGLSVIIWAMMIAMIASAMPNVRQKIHNVFEIMHRFGGWSIQGLVWVQLVTFATIVAEVKKESIGIALIKQPAFWFLVVIFCFTLYPWLRLRKIDIRIEKLSKHAVRVWFDGYVKPIRTIRISDSPLMEVHAFATIPEPDGRRGFSSILSNAGDWTKRFIANPPDKVWVRDLYSWGLLHIGVMFSKIVLVTTGSGIGPCLSLFNSKYEIPCRILWSTRNPEQTYGKKILDMVRKWDPNALIIDTGDKGRHDMVQLSYDLYRESGAEAVVVISNPTLTYKVVFGLESRGIPAYGPIWDS